MPSSDLFLTVGGWSERIGPAIANPTALAGDGLDLVMRALEVGAVVAPLPELVIDGGHRASRPPDDPVYELYGRGTIQVGRHWNLPKWYLYAQTVRATLKGTVAPLPDPPELFGTRGEWRQRARGMRRELLRREDHSP